MLSQEGGLSTPARLPRWGPSLAPRAVALTTLGSYTVSTRTNYFSSEARRFSIEVRNSSGVPKRPCTA